MLLLLLMFSGGVLTILSPCILPILPFIFARANQPFVKSTLPLLAGLVLTFAGIATLAAIGGSWAVRINQYGRVFALVLLIFFAATLLSRTLADRLTRPFVALGNRLIQTGPGTTSNAGIVHSLVLGIATGLLWAPCAGPILGLALTGAAISGPTIQTTFLLLAYAAGAAFSLALATLAGGRLFETLKKNLGVGEWVRRLLGVTVLFAVVAIIFGWDTNLLTRLSTANTTQLEQALIDKINPDPEAENSMAGAMMGGAMTGTAMEGAMAGPGAAKDVAAEGQLPAFTGATSWLNSAPLTPESLRGKVVLIDFWTYSCINCLRALPYVKAWNEKYKDHGLVIIGIHSPEFAFEKDAGNVEKAVRNLGITYPVALDNNYAIWQAFNNKYWPAHYFIDAAGRIRSHHFGEGHYDESEQTIRKLLMEAGATDLPVDGTNTQATGVQAAADEANVKSPETYLGFSRAENFSSPNGFAQAQEKLYTLPPKLSLNQWALAGNWLVDKEKAVLIAAPGKIVFRFSARDLHLVIGPGADGKPIRFRVRLDDADPGKDHGVDIDAGGNGVINEQRLYQLIRQSDSIGEHTFTIEFLDDGAQAYSFTFG